MRLMVTVFELSNPWPTPDDAITTAASVAKQAYDIYGDRLDSLWMYGSLVRGTISRIPTWTCSWLRRPSRSIHATS